MDFAQILAEELKATPFLLLPDTEKKKRVPVMIKSFGKLLTGWIISGGFKNAGKKLRLLLQNKEK